MDNLNFSCDYDKYRFIEPVHFLNLSFCSSKFFFEIKTWCNKTPNQSLYLFFAFTQAFNDRQSYNPYPSQPDINPKHGLSDSDRLERLNGRSEWPTVEGTFWVFLLKPRNVSIKWIVFSRVFKILFLSFMLNNESWLIEPKGKVKNFYVPVFTS